MPENSAELYREIMERMSDGVVLLDHDGRCVLINPAAERLLGKLHVQAVGGAVWDAVPGPIGEALKKARDRVLGGQRVLLLRSHFAQGRWYDAAALPMNPGLLLVLHDVTQRLESDAARRQTEERFRLLVDSICDYAIFALDLTGHVASWNQGAERIKGYRASEILGKHFSIFYPADAVKEGRPLRALEIASTEGRFEDEGWRVRKDGSRFWASAAITAVHNELGDPRGFVKVIRDMTDRKRLEDQLRLAEAKSSGIISIATDAIISIDEAQRISVFNEGACRIFGYSQAEALGAPLGVLLPEQLRSIHQEHVRRFAAEPVSARRMGERSLSIQGRRKTGEVFPAEAAISKIEVGGKTVLTVILRDITDRVRGDEALRATEERLRLAVASAEMGTWESSPLTSQTIADRRTKELLGLSPDDELNFEVFLARVHPDDRPRVVEARQRALNPANGGSYEIEHRIVRLLDGAERWIASHGKVHHDGEGRPTRFVGVIFDTTERHQIEEMRERLPGILAHDLRSPLSAVQMSSEALRRRQDLPPSAVGHLKIIARGTARMARMVEQLLDWTRTRFGCAMPLDRTPVDLATLCREGIADLAATGADRQVRLRVQGDCTGQWDRMRLSEVVSNLIDNAVKHGSSDSAIDVTARQEGDDVVLEVHNAGAPIPADALPLVFEPFRRARTPPGPGARGGGLGLGLYIVREIVAAHDGRIDVRSSLAEGTTFTVRLQRRSPTAAAPQPDV